MSLEFKSRHNRPRNKPKTPAILKIFTLLMAFVYAGFGIFILTSSQEQLAIPQNFKVILGVMLIFYSLVRAYRAYQKYYGKPKRFYDEDEDQ